MPLSRDPLRPDEWPPGLPASVDRTDLGSYIELPFCAHCRKAMVSPCSPGQSEPYFDLAPGEPVPDCVPGHDHEEVVWASVPEEDSGADLSERASPAARP
ncbi:hypothetical protein [Streptomyces californicus]|uniref:hypothetical protein n=1 Tax=Streptomyces californicus TaxID=67351 RepID=UPI00296FEEB3|nr:hypothetical protein [Streptomyces californicus]MDW4912609.1 hypothetical protein [Streptomyces californicus]